MNLKCWWSGHDLKSNWISKYQCNEYICIRCGQDKGLHAYSDDNLYERHDTLFPILGAVLVVIGILSVITAIGEKLI